MFNMSEYTDAPIFDESHHGDRELMEAEAKYFTREEIQETLALNLENRKNREKRMPFIFRSGSVYEGNWVGSQRDG